MIVCRTKIALNLITHGDPAAVPEVLAHLEWALSEARRLELPEAAIIEQILGRSQVE
jgi:hypothetical protein